MENQFDTEVYGFGPSEDVASDGFKYDTISGLGESNYENEDLFGTDNSVNKVNTTVNNNQGNGTDNEKTFNNNGFDPNFNPFGNIEYTNDLYNPNFKDDSVVDLNNNSLGLINNKVKYNEPVGEPINNTLNNETQESLVNEVLKPVPHIPVKEEVKEENKEVIDNPFRIEQENVQNEVPIMQTEPIESPIKEEVSKVKEEKIEEPKVEEPIIKEEPKIVMSNTPIEELNKLTEYKEQKLESTDINELFDKVNLNVKDASDIFRKNTEMKDKIDSRFNELKKLQSEIENSKKNQFDEINKYKEEVLNKLTEKKEEIEKRLNTLKTLQATLEKEKADFEKYKNEEQEKINSIKKEVQSAYDERREELSHIEDTLRAQKDSLDEERNQLSLDKMKYESDKNDLANNLLKFNDLVNSFTSGVGDLNN